jgi:replication factor C large subunit
MTPWTKKYQPKNINEIIGQDTPMQKLQEFLKLKRPVLIYGPTGTGKTCAAETLGKELNLEVFEINSSDARNKENIENILGSCTMQQSLFSKGKLIIIDDIDALSGTKDRGGLPAIEKILETCKYPLIITCIDPWDDKFSKIRRKCALIEFSPIKKEHMLASLKLICEQEKISFSEKDLIDIIKSAKGDLRGAITDLQTFSTTKVINTDEKSEREKSEDLIACLRKIFKSKKWDETINIFDKTDENLDQCLLWLDENLPKEYNSEDLKKGYNLLSRADVFQGRIRRWQHWRFLVYINILITSGIAISKTEANTNIIEYQRTTRLLKLWQANMRNAKRNSIADKLAAITHTSKKRAIKDTFPYLKPILHNPKIIHELNLDDEEIFWLKK